MPIAGLTRLRKHQFGRQTTFGTKVAAKRAYPFGGTPGVNLNWTDPEGDFGSLDPIAPPTRGAPDIAASLTDPALAYDNLPLILAAIFGDAVTASGAGTSKTWAFAPASLTPDVFDVFTYEFGDDVTGDWFQLGDGILTSLTVNGPETMGVLTTSQTWKFGSASSTGSTDSPVTGTVPTAALSVDTAAVPVYLKDATLYIDSTPGAIGTTPITNALHTFQLTVTQAVDEKRWADGTQTFDIEAYGRGARAIELALQFSKTADTVGTGSEADAWFSDTAVNRFLRLAWESTALAEAAIPYSWVFDMPLRYYTRSDDAIGGNSTVTLTGHAYYEAATIAKAFSSTVINKLATAGL